MKVLHRRSTKRVAAFTTALATAAFLVQLAAPSAFAAAPPSDIGSFFPVHDGATVQFDQDGTTTALMTVLSDKADGVDSTAHLTAVTSPAGTSPTTIAATLVQWYHCDSGLVPPSCPVANKIGEDTTATTPVETPGYTAAGGDTIDDAWSIGWDIPATLDNTARDIVAVGCNGAPDATFSNCVTDAVPGVLLDDSGSGNNPQTSSGEITAPINGSAVSSDVDSTASASTSVELTAVAFGLDDFRVDSGDDGNGPAGFDDVDENQQQIDTTPNTTTATAKTWSVTLNASSMDGNRESALTLSDTDNGSATSPPGFATSQCGAGAGTCAYDRHYIVTEEGTPGTAAQVAVKQSADVTADATCTTGPSSIFSPAGSTVNLTGCVFDAFRNAVASEGVFWSLVNTPPTGGGFFVGTPQLVSDTAGHATAAVSSASTSAGSTTVVTFCLDDNKNGVCDSTTPGPKNATFTITWGVAGGGNQHARTVSLRLRDGLTARGKVTATGFAACAANVPVKFQKRVSGHWKTLKKVTTSGTGSYRAHVGNTHGRFRSLAPKVTLGTDICKRAVSPRRAH